MKKTAYLSILLLFIAFNVALADGQVEYSVYTDALTCYNPILDGYFFPANTDIKFEIRAANNTSEDICDLSTSIRVYSTPGDYSIIWIDAGGSPEPSVVLTGGFDNGAYWDQSNEITTMSWDGNLPDTLHHSAAGCLSNSGWPAGDPLSTRYELHMNIPMVGEIDTTSVCFDSVDVVSADWLFDPLVDIVFGGPYCFPFAIEIYFPPYVEIYMDELTTTHDIPFEVSAGIYDLNNEIPTGVGAIDEYGNPIGDATLYPSSGPFGWMATLDWTFDPPCEWATDGLTHTVRFYAEQEPRGVVFPCVEISDAVTLIVTNTPPEIAGDCGNRVIVPVNGSSSAEFFTIDPDSDGSEEWSAEVTGEPDGTYEIVDGVLTLNATELDDGGDYAFTVRVTECPDVYDECVVFFYARSEIICGDATFTNGLNILDVVSLINCLYKGGPCPKPDKHVDVNSDMSVNILDIVRLINYLYKDGPEPDCPL